MQNCDSSVPNAVWTFQPCRTLSRDFKAIIRRLAAAVIVTQFICGTTAYADDDPADTEFFEREIRPLLIEHCYECHSEEAQEQLPVTVLGSVVGSLF